MAPIIYNSTQHEITQSIQSISECGFKPGNLPGSSILNHSGAGVKVLAEPFPQLTLKVKQSTVLTTNVFL